MRGKGRCLGGVNRDDRFSGADPASGLERPPVKKNSARSDPCLWIRSHPAARADSICPRCFSTLESPFRRHIDGQPS
ncbi:MAG: hypothetical protein CMJ23_14655 [Phycisphaerae bacterium]|nr:hypothetical protein [Phycisphaerae bacterium]